MGKVECQPGRWLEMAGVLAEMVEAARQEPGVEIYSYLRGDSDTFWFFAVMTDEESMMQHGRTEAMQAAMAKLFPLAESAPEMWQATPIAAVGFAVDAAMES